MQIIQKVQSNNYSSILSIEPFFSLAQIGPKPTALNQFLGEEEVSFELNKYQDVNLLDQYLNYRYINLKVLEC